MGHETGVKPAPNVHEDDAGLVTLEMGNKKEGEEDSVIQAVLALRRGKKRVYYGVAVNRLQEGKTPESESRCAV